MQDGMTYPRPDRRSRIGGQGATVYPYPDRLLREQDIFPLFVLDGGAFFFTMERLGGGSGVDFLRAYDNGTLLAPWRTKRGIAWDRAYDETVGAPRQALEQHVWLNRLYFLLPLAQRAFRTGDRHVARAWFTHFEAWRSAHPAPARLNPDRHANKSVWFDMQITWRLLVFIHSLALLGRIKGIAPARWAALHTAIRQHAGFVLEEARKQLEAGTGRGNHFLQKGTALLYAGILFPDLPEAADWVSVGRGIVAQQMAAEILPDGASVEASPSYSHFIARLYLDARRLLDLNGQKPIPGLKSCIRRQYAWLSAMRSPSGLTLQINDSYAMDAEYDLALVRQLFPIGRPKAVRTACFPASRYAVLQRARFHAYVEAGHDRPLRHHHAGTPRVLVYLDGRPLVVDSGCCNYDRTLWMYLRGSTAHATVSLSVHGRALDADVPDSAVFSPLPRRTGVVVIRRFSVKGGAVVWRRTVRVSDHAVRMTDRIAAPRPVRAIWRLPLAPVDVRLLPPDGALIRRGRSNVRVSLKGGGPISLNYTPAMDPRNVLVEAPALVSNASGKTLRFTLVVRPQVEQNTSP